MRKMSWLVSASIATIAGLFSLLSWGTDELSWVFHRRDEILGILAAVGGLGAAVSSFVLARKRKSRDE